MHLLLIISIILFVTPLSTMPAATPTASLGWSTPNEKFYFHFPPDPVNVRTLNFFYPVVHFAQPCFIPIEIRAAYNSYASDSSIFGKKWTFNHNVYVRDAITHYEVVEGDGYVNQFTREKNLEKATAALVQKVIIALKKEDAKKNQLKDDGAYDEIEKRLKDDKNYRETEARRLIKTARPLGPGKYFSLARGQAELEKQQDGSYVRSFQNGSRELFNADGQLTRSEDRNGNFVTYVYQNKKLNRINDMCGRSVFFTYQTKPGFEDLVAGIRDSLGRTFSYTFNSEQLLASFADNALKTKTSYRYDKFENLIEIKTEGSKSETIRMSYNEKLEVSEQSGPDDSRSTYKRSFVGNNPNHSITEIIKYKGKSVQGREVHEFKSGEYEITTEFGPDGKERSKSTKRFSAATGYPESIFDQRGHGDKFKYDSDTGNLLEREKVPSGEKIIFTYIERCNQVNSVSVIQPNQLPKVTTYTFDPKCNVITAVEKTGEQVTGNVEVKYTQQGKTQFLIDKLNDRQIAFTYWKYGKPESITLKDSGTLLVKYQPAGQIDNVNTFPHGKGKERFAGQDENTARRSILKEVRGALDSMLAFLRPAGLNIGL